MQILSLLMHVVGKWNRNGKENKTEVIIMPVYKPMVFPFGEYCMHLCTTQVKRDVAELKKVWGAKRVIGSMEHLLPKERQGTLGLFNVKKR